MIFLLLLYNYKTDFFFFLKKQSLITTPSNCLHHHRNRLGAGWPSYLNRSFGGGWATPKSNRGGQATIENRLRVARPPPINFGGGRWGWLGHSPLISGVADPPSDTWGDPATPLSFFFFVFLLFYYYFLVGFFIYYYLGLKRVEKQLG
jgi:hypothetical protein